MRFSFVNGWNYGEGQVQNKLFNAPGPPYSWDQEPPESVVSPVKPRPFTPLCLAKILSILARHSSIENIEAHKI
jgi:hypothetical protein